MSTFLILYVIYRLAISLYDKLIVIGDKYDE